MFSKIKSVLTNALIAISSFVTTAALTVSTARCQGLFEEGTAATMAQNFYDTIGIPILEIGWIPLLYFGLFGFLGDEKKSNSRFKLALLILLIYVAFLLGGAFAYGSITGLANAITGK